jgi:hypothetical protein
MTNHPMQKRSGASIGLDPPQHALEPEAGDHRAAEPVAELAIGLELILVEELIAGRLIGKSGLRPL